MYGELALTDVFCASIIYVSQSKWERLADVVIYSDQNFHILS